jgi:hypothetical protein
MGVDIIWVTDEHKGRKNFLFSIYTISPSATFLWNLTVTEIGEYILCPLVTSYSHIVGCWLKFTYNVTFKILYAVAVVSDELCMNHDAASVVLKCNHVFYICLLLQYC